jgi:steroid 5-alpha reductase family enzyme
MTPLLLGLAAVIVFFTVLWVVSLALRNASIVDIWWGPGFLVLAGVYAWTMDGVDPRRALVLGLVALWALRLAWHIGRRNIGHGEDFRYAEWRRENGASWWWYSYLKVFLLQAIVAWIVALPLYFAIGASGPARLTVLDAAGLVLFAVGFVFEAVGDEQMRRFKADPSNRGRVMREGLWRYTRHPNYFGEAVLWWGLGAMAAATPGGAVGLVGPALLTFLLLRVSGVTMLEAALVERKLGYADYVETTPAFVPWWPKSRVHTTGPG